jgi:hypothetical protein
LYGLAVSHAKTAHSLNNLHCLELFAGIGPMVTFFGTWERLFTSHKGPPQNDAITSKPCDLYIYCNCSMSLRFFPGRYAFCIETETSEVWQSETFALHIIVHRKQEVPMLQLVQRKVVSGFPKLFLLVATVFLFMSFAVMGCNGSDGDDDDTGGSQTANDLLNGSYRFDLFADDHGDFWNQSDAMTFDGSGGFDLTIVYDSGGDSASISGTYTVDSDGSLSIADTDLRGQASADGNLFATTDTNPDDDDGDIILGVGLKYGSGLDASVMNGSYTVCQIRNDGATKASRMSFTFDGTGNLSGEILEDTDGTTGALTGTYTVAADGALGVVVNGLSKTFGGNVSPDGNLFQIYDTDDDGEVLVMIGLKKTSSGMSAASLSGDYQLNMMAEDSTAPWTSRIAMTADGLGSISAEILAASDGDLSTPPDMSYTVTGDGTLTIDGTEQTGQLSSDGEVFIMVDTDNSIDGEVMLMIGIKKS